MKLQKGGLPANTRIDKPKTKVVRVIGGGLKHKLLSADTVTLHTKDNKVVRAVVEKVVDNPANRHFIRRNIITKGAIVQTDKGLVRITSRPGQHNVLNGVLLEQ